MATLEQNIDKNIAKLEIQLELWNARLNELVARGKLTGQEVKAAVDVAQARLADVKKAGADKWESFQATLEDAWKQAEAAFKKIID